MAAIILVDDHALFRLGVRMAIEMSGEEFRLLAEAGSAAELWPLLEAGLPDLLLLDIILPDMNGVEIAKQVRKKYPDLPILVLSAETGEETILELLQAGINGFISKMVVNEGLLTAMRTVLGGDQYYGSDISTILDHMIFTSQRGKGADGGILFTEREHEVATLCCEGYPTKIISSRLGISPRTVEAHKANIFLKLGVTNLAELVHYCFKHGIVKL